jgi:hypothetical protein
MQRNPLLSRQVVSSPANPAAPPDGNRATHAYRAVSF